MSGLPNLPGYTFKDPTQVKFHLQQTLTYHNGYQISKIHYSGVGGKVLTRDTFKGIGNFNPVSHNPSHIYGLAKSKSFDVPQFTPHYVLYDQKCLTFKAYFHQSIVDSADESTRFRFVNIIYFLEDDTITVIEPNVPNSGLYQGRLVRRGKIPKNNRGEYWHWKDLNIGKDVAIYGIVFHINNCDLFTREYLISQGVVVVDQTKETEPVDAYTQSRQFKKPNMTKTRSPDDKLRRFLEFDGKILRFKAAWDDRENEYGELRKFEILYFLCDDTVLVKEIHEKNDGRDPTLVLLRKTKLPKRYTDTPVTYPTVYLEISDAEETEYYLPKDFLIGKTIFVLGRDMLLYDCDQFTRDYFKNALCIDQKQAIPVEPKKSPPPLPQVPPHNGIGSLEDSFQNTLTVLPKRPKKDIMRQIVNASKYLRYEMAMDCVHPEDTIRRFILLSSLADGTCRILEPPIKNSGIIGGTYLRSTNLIKPESDPLNPDFYTPADFYIGAVITVFGQRFKIIGADLYVYRYMQANESKFPCEVIENLRNYMFHKGYLNIDIEDTVEDILDNERQWDLDTEGRRRETELEKCYREQKIGEGVDPEYELIREHDSVKHTRAEVPYGIKSVQKSCKYPVHVGDVKSDVCEDDEEYQSYTPKLEHTPEEIIAKYYTGVLKDHHNICDGTHAIECDHLPQEGSRKKPEMPTTLKVFKPDVAPGACKHKTVTFADYFDQDKYDLCGLKTRKTHCGCTDYKLY